MGDLERLAVRRNGWCQAWADHRQGRKQCQNPAAKALNDLFSFRVSSKEACEQFFDSIRFFNRPQQKFGAGQAAERRAYGGVRTDRRWQGCVVRDPVPSYIEESAVVVDFKGENSQLTAEHQAEGVRPPDRRARPVQIGYADP